MPLLYTGIGFERSTHDMKIGQSPHPVPQFIGCDLIGTFNVFNIFKTNKKIMLFIINIKLKCSSVFFGLTVSITISIEILTSLGAC